MNINYIKPQDLFEGLEWIESKDLQRKYVNFYPSGVSAGFPKPTDDFIEHKLSLDERYAYNPETTFFVRLTGMSMYDTFLENDILIVHTDKRVENLQVGIFSVNGSKYTTKRLDIKNKLLLPDNKLFSTIAISETDVVNCLGRVIAFLRELT